MATDTVTITEIEFEEDIRNNPYSPKNWWRYLQYKHAAPAKERNLLHERALQHIPGSYKLWFQYLSERMLQVRDRPLDDAGWEAVNNAFERALIFMSKMPRIWQEYLSFLVAQYKVTDVRKTMDRALQSLPITQHEKVWKVAIDFVKQTHVPVETAYRIWKRYLQLEPFLIEDFVIYLKKHQRWNDVINVLIKALNDPRFVSVKGKTRHELWVELCSLISKQGDSLHLDDHSLTVDNIIRSGIVKFPNEVGQLWCALADYSIRCGHFDRARDIYEEGITSVSTVKDFSQIFDSYSQFEESLLTAKMEKLDQGDESDDEEGDQYMKALYKVADVEFTLTEEVDFRLERLNFLMSRNPELLNSVLLRQNPHNVYEWRNRVNIFKDKPEKVVKTFTEAVTTVDPFKATGKPHTLWVQFARWYENRGDLRSARLIFERALKINFKAIDDLASVWVEYAEMEIRHKKYRKALEILRKATATSFTGQGSWKTAPGTPVQDRVWRSVKLWCFYADLNESLCTVKSTKNVYERAIYLKVCTPQMILNFARYMQENGYWEESFKAYEQGVALFQWPLVYDIWVEYATAFISRYRGKKVERVRDLFQQAVAKVPPEHAKRMYLMYAKYEEKYGLARQCLSIYDEACTKVKDEEKLEMFRLYIKTSRKFFGVARTREVYERAIQRLPEPTVPEMCMEYAEVEKALGEIDRARSVFVHGAQFVDPRKENNYWPAFHQFEVTHGNEDTFREMLRIRRSVQSTYSNTINLAAAAEQAKMERQQKRDEEEVKANVQTEATERTGKIQANPDTERVTFQQPSLEELAGEQAGENAKGDEEEVQLETMAVPEQVFGDIRKRPSDEKESQLAKRLKRE